MVVVVGGTVTVTGGAVVAVDVDEVVLERTGASPSSTHASSASRSATTRRQHRARAHRIHARRGSMAHDLTFGVFVPQGWKMELASIEDPQAKWAKAVEVAKLAEDLGLDSLWVYDHFHNVPVPAHETMFECWTTMAAISQVTSRIKLGQMVGCAPYRNPVAAGQDHLEHRRDVRRPAHLGHRRRLVRARVQGLRLPVPQGVGPDRRAPGDGRDREGDVERARRAPTTGSTSSSTAPSATRSRSSSRTRRS